VLASGESFLSGCSPAAVELTALFRVVAGTCSGLGPWTRREFPEARACYLRLIAGRRTGRFWRALAPAGCVVAVIWILVIVLVPRGTGALGIPSRSRVLSP